MGNAYVAAAKFIQPSNVPNALHAPAKIVLPAEMSAAKTQMAIWSIGKSIAHDCSMLST